MKQFSLRAECCGLNKLGYIFLNPHYEELKLVVEEMIIQGGRRSQRMEFIITVLNMFHMEEVLIAVFILCVILMCQFENGTFFFQFNTGMTASVHIVGPEDTGPHRNS